MDKISGLISIARKAGYCVIGQDNLKNYDKKLYLIMLDSTAGASVEREMNFLSNKKQIPLERIENLSKKIAIENCKVIAIKNKNFSENILKVLKGE